MESLINFMFILPGLLLAIISHELAHGYMAYALGDDTAKNAGRLSLNPIRHIDPIGLLAMLILKFGWAKPVPIDSRNFENRKIGMILVSLAGPGINFIQAIIIAFILVRIPIRSAIISLMLSYALMYNVILGVFNLLPFPPLDGSKVIASLLPVKWEYYFYKNEKYFYMILIFLLFTGRVDNIIWPLIEGVKDFIIKLVY